jgi:hypothetical protein
MIGRGARPWVWVAAAAVAACASPGQSSDGATPDRPIMCGDIVMLTAAAPDAGWGPCTYLFGPTPSSYVSWDFIKVFVGGDLVPHDTTRTDGWDVLDAYQTGIEIFGPACDAITAGTAGGVSAEFYCLLI